MYNTFARVLFQSHAILNDIRYIKGFSDDDIKNGRELGIHILDDYHIRFQLHHPTHLFLKHLGIPDLSIIKLESPRSNYSYDDQKTGFSGVYALASISNEEIILKKNRTSDLDSKKPPETVIYINPEESDILNFVDLKKIDNLSIANVPPAINVELKSRGWKEVVTKGSFQWFLLLNPNIIPKPLRKKIFSQITTSNEISKLDTNVLERAYGVIPNTLKGHLSKEDQVTFSQFNFSIPTKPIEIIYHQDNPVSEEIREIIRIELSALGVPFKFIPLGIDAYLSKLFSKQYQMIIAAKGLDYPDGFGVLSYFFAGKEDTYFLMITLKLTIYFKKLQAQLRI